MHMGFYFSRGGGGIFEKNAILRKLFPRKNSHVRDNAKIGFLTEDHGLRDAILKDAQL